jgi:hypothetical protein
MASAYARRLLGKEGGAEVWDAATVVSIIAFY